MALEVDLVTGEFHDHEQHAQFRTPPEFFEEKKLDSPLLKRKHSACIRQFQSTKRKERMRTQEKEA